MKDGAEAGMEGNCELIGKDDLPLDLKKASSFTREVQDSFLGGAPSWFPIPRWIEKVPS